MRNSVRYIVETILILLFCAGMAWLLVRTRREAAGESCTGIDISFSDSLKFVSEAEIRKYLQDGYGSCTGKRLINIDLAAIEQLLESKTAIKNSEAWTNSDGILHIRISQRTPALRFIENGKGFYVDGTGYVFPLHKSFTAPVRVIKGAIPEFPQDFKGQAEDPGTREWILQLLAMNRHIESSRIWRNRISGITVKRNRDLVLRTSDSDTYFIFGEPADFEEKFSKMEKFYSHILPYRGEGYYTSADLKYNKQIICRKDI